MNMEKIYYDKFIYEDSILIVIEQEPKNVFKASLFLSSFLKSFLRTTTTTTTTTTRKTFWPAIRR